MTDPQYDTQPMRPVTLPEKPKRTPAPSERFPSLDIPFPEKRKRGTPETPRGGCLIPAWSVLLMLIVVFGCAFGILALAVALGGDDAPGGEPVIVVLTPITTPTSPMEAFSTTPTPTLMAITDAQAARATFALSGPTLAPVIFTPTPLGIAVGLQVIVDVDGGLNVRNVPGLDSDILFRAGYQELFIVTDGPENQNGLTWWRIQDPSNPARAGWAAGEYLVVSPQN